MRTGQLFLRKVCSTLHQHPSQPTSQCFSSAKPAPLRHCPLFHSRDVVLGGLRVAAPFAKSLKEFRGLNPLQMLSI